MVTLENPPQLEYCEYTNESELDAISELIAVQLSEPYSDFTYRYFLLNFPKANFVVYDRANGNKMIGCVVSKIDVDRKDRKCGYIGMLAVDPLYRGQKIGKYLWK